MLKPEQVPDVSLKEFRKALFSDKGGRAAIAAAINAWPMASPYEYYVGPDGKPSPSIILPLPQEETDG